MSGNVREPLENNFILNLIEEKNKVNLMSIINVEGIKLYAYHGCLDEEAVIGGEYIVDVFLETDLSAACKSDDLSQTIDYVKVYRIVKREMAIRSKLIEHVGKRISDALHSEYKTLQKVRVKVTKINPPVNGYVEKVSVEI